MRRRIVFLALASLGALPMFGGGFEPWLATAVSAVLLLAALALPGGTVRALDPRSRALLMLAGAAATWACLQCLPVAESWRRFLSPGAAALDAALGRVPGRAATSYDPGASLRAAVALLGVGVLIAAVAWLGREGRGRRQVLAVVAVSSALVASLGLAAFVAGWDLTPTAPEHAKSFATFVNRNHAGALSILGLPILAALAWTRRSTATGRVAAVAAALVLLALAANGSRGAALGLGVSLMLGAWCWHRRGRTPRMLVALVLGVVAAGQALGRHSDTITVDQRVSLLRDSMQLVADAPLAGVGLGAFAAAHGPYQSIARPLRFRHCECEPLEWMVEGGLPLAVIGVAALTLVVRSAWRVLRDTGRHPVERAAALGLFAVLLQSLVDFPLRVPGVVYPTLMVAVSLGVSSVSESAS